jgi:hypothetical protein
MLLKDRYLVEQDGYLLIRNFRDAQLRYDRVRAEKPDDVKQTSGGLPDEIRKTSGGLPADLRLTSGGLAVGGDGPKPAKLNNPDRRSDSESDSESESDTHTQNARAHDPTESVEVGEVRCSTIEHLNPFDPDVALDEVRKASEDQWHLRGSSLDMDKLKALAKTAHPPLSLEDFRLLGEGYKRTHIFDWYRERYGKAPTLGYLLEGDAKRLFDAISEVHDMDREDKTRETEKQRRLEEERALMGSKPAMDPKLKELLEKRRAEAAAFIAGIGSSKQEKLS